MARVVVHDAVAVGVDAGQDRRAAGRAQRRVTQAFVEVRALARQPVEVRRLQETLALQEPQRIVAMIVGQDEDDVARLPLCGGEPPRQGQPRQLR